MAKLHLLDQILTFSKTQSLKNSSKSGNPQISANCHWTGGIFMPEGISCTSTGGIVIKKGNIFQI
jgi:hypothetical protein